ncbi:hypothetical protein [Acetobacterium bakii]|nr:hypothetical protein [Acetobacterium bakii]
MRIPGKIKSVHIFQRRLTIMKIPKRLKVSLITGAVLGVFCIIGALVRFGFQIENYLLFSLWYNRLLMGLVIGLPWAHTTIPKLLARGAVLGLIVSFAYYSSTGFADIVSFLAGIVYGMIIEYVAFMFTNAEIERVRP